MSKRHPTFAGRIAPAFAVTSVGMLLVRGLDHPTTVQAVSATNMPATTASNTPVVPVQSSGFLPSMQSTVPAVLVTPAPANTSAPVVTNAPATNPPAPAEQTACGAIVKQGSQETIQWRRTYGDITVTARFDGNGTLCKVSANYNTYDNRSSEYESWAVPKLNSQAVAAHSAHINGVSGATAVSDAYSKSLQSAIDTKGN